MKKALYIYRASAGSGKTFTLAVEYIKLLIANPGAYRHTLAVTFTNKATGEMKERILSQLYGIANNLPSSDGYRDKVAAAFPDIDNEELSRRARTAMQMILHDYGHFRIQTIDAFFQSILRGLAKELELSGDMEITLDSTELLNDTVDLLIKRLTPTSNEMAWLVEYIEEHLENDKSWRVREAIKDFARNILKEEYQERGDELRRQIEQDNGALLAEYRKTLRRIEADITARVKTLGKRFFDIAQANGLGADDFFYKKNGIWAHFDKLRQGELIPPGARVIDCMENPGKISKRLSTEQCEEIALLMRENADMSEKELATLNNCRLSLGNFHRLRLLNSIAKTLNDENNRENRFLLAQTTYLLNRMIDNDTSFIFEKIGTEINHIFIDEFQDTSRLQWSCFKVLLHEVMSRGTYNLIVGDVKQSIYRWRNSDWNILNNIENEFPRETINDYATGNTGNHTTNYRSARRIIEFNNALFREASRSIAESYREQLGDSLHDLTKAYSDANQAIPANKPSTGYAEVRMIEKEDAGFDATVYARLTDTLRMLLTEKGVQPGDITILVRTRSVIPAIVEQFNNALPEFGIVSDDAYRLSASSALRIIMSAIRNITTPDDRINSVELAMLYNKEVLGVDLPPEKLHTTPNCDSYLPQAFISERARLAEKPVYELIERIIKEFGLADIDGQQAYLYSFLDHATQYIGGNACTLQGFIEAWNNELCEKTIPASDDNSVKITTIHKSKGLEFHTVIIPFCTWKITGDTRNIIWCNPQETPFDMLSMLPINCSSAMLKSIYREEYNREYLFQLVDNLNLLYVACTRAVENLFVFTDAQPKAHTVGHLLKNIMGNLGLEDADYDKGRLFTYGTLSPSVTKATEEDNNPFTATAKRIEQPFVSFSNRLTSRQSHNLTRFIASDNKQDEHIEYIAQGELMHDIMSRLATGNELPRELKRLQMEGLISTEAEYNGIKRVITNALANPMAREWFSGRYRLFNEHTILYSGNGRQQACRPDRVMVSDNETVVVDFKFGTPRQKYSEQVREYATLLAQMGYRNIKGYLWYMYNNKIEEVTL